MAGPAEAGVAAWHEYVRNVSPEALEKLLAEDVVFQSPVVHTPQEGRAITMMYLLAAFNVFPGDSNKQDGGTSSSDGADNSEGNSEGKSQGKFQYVREVVGDYDAVLEFTTEMDGIKVNGVDMIKWNDEGKIIDFKVMIRPLKAIQTIHAQMGRMLEAMKSG